MNADRQAVDCNWHYVSETRYMKPLNLFSSSFVHMPWTWTFVGMFCHKLIEQILPRKDLSVRPPVTSPPQTFHVFWWNLVALCRECYLVNLNFVHNNKLLSLHCTYEYNKSVCRRRRHHHHHHQQQYHHHHHHQDQDVFIRSFPL
jgi:hypothetical protein